MSHQHRRWVRFCALELLSGSSCRVCRVGSHDRLEALLPFFLVPGDEHSPGGQIWSLWRSGHRCLAMCGQLSLEIREKRSRGRKRPRRARGRRVSRSEHGEPHGADLWPGHSHPTSGGAPCAIGIAVGSDSALWNVCAVAHAGSVGRPREGRGGRSRPNRPCHLGISTEAAKPNHAVVAVRRGRRTGSGPGE